MPIKALSLLLFPVAALLGAEMVNGAISNKQAHNTSAHTSSVDPATLSQSNRSVAASLAQAA